MGHEYSSDSSSAFLQLPRPLLAIQPPSPEQFQLVPDKKKAQTPSGNAKTKVMSVKDLNAPKDNTSRGSKSTEENKKEIETLLGPGLCCEIVGHKPAYCCRDPLDIFTRDIEGWRDDNVVARNSIN